MAFAGSVKELPLVTTPLSATLNSDPALASQDGINSGRRPNNSKEPLASQDSVKRGHQPNKSKDSVASQDPVDRGRRPKKLKDSLVLYDPANHGRELNNSKESLVSHDSCSGIWGSNVSMPPSPRARARRRNPDPDRSGRYSDSDGSREQSLNYKRRSPRKCYRPLTPGPRSYASSDTSSSASSKNSSRGRPRHRPLLPLCDGGPATPCDSNIPNISHSRRIPCEQRYPILRRESSEAPGIDHDRRNQKGRPQQPLQHGPQQPPQNGPREPRKHGSQQLSKHGSRRSVSPKDDIKDNPRSEAHHSQRELEAGERYPYRRGAYQDKCKSRDREPHPHESSSYPPHREKKSPPPHASEPCKELVRRPKSHSRNSTPVSPMPIQLRYSNNGDRSSRLPRPPSGYEYVENPKVFARMLNGVEPNVLHMPGQLSSYSGGHGYGYEQNSEVFMRQLDVEPNVLYMPHPPLRPYGRQAYTRGYLYNTPYYSS